MPFPNQELLSSSQRSYGVTKTLCNLRLVLGGKPGGQLVIWTTWAIRIKVLWKKYRK